MNILLTRFFYPIHEPIELCKTLKIKLENPNQSETVILAEFLEANFSVESAWSVNIKKARHIVKELSEIEGEIGNYFKKNSGIENPFIIIAGLCVIVRFDDDGFNKSIQEEGDEIFESTGSLPFVLLDDDHPYLEKVNSVVNYLHCLSLLLVSNFDGYNGSSMLLLTSDQDIPSRKINSQVALNFTIFYMGQYSNEEKNEASSIALWLSFPKHLSNIKLISNLIGTVYKDYPDKINYIGSLLNTSLNEIQDPNYVIITLVSIIEMLLTHNPDFNRFNIEDSINKQFVLKMLILLNYESKNCNLEYWEIKLKEIYKLRSMIAHGDFKGVMKYKENLKKKLNKDPEDSEGYFEKIIENLYFLIQIIIKSFLENPKFIELLQKY
ncbi:MAG: hypothetical protein IPO06_17360 [Leptospiraceae bacterium]|nr:hypothetical protein [Leptospiraceae bacterium]MBK9501100.1 hypothetical protein [Leptospiraceae bacterium]